jgi:hypothetical protein
MLPSVLIKPPRLGIQMRKSVLLIRLATLTISRRSSLHGPWRTPGLLQAVTAIWAMTSALSWSSPRFSDTM